MIKLSLLNIKTVSVIFLVVQDHWYKHVSVDHLIPLRGGIGDVALLYYLPWTELVQRNLQFSYTSVVFIDSNIRFNNNKN
jgi:hypothetical protein